MKKTLGLVLAPFALTLAALPLAGNATAHDDSDGPGRPPRLPGGFTHLVVIYEENHSFDNLYGEWGSVGGEPVDGLQNATPANSTQVDQSGAPYTCLLQNDLNLATPPLPADCADGHTVTNNNGTVKAVGFTSHFGNQPYAIDDFVKATDTTCPPPGDNVGNGRLNGTGEPGGCTRDLVHRFYQEQYQINGGAQNRYVTGSDAVGLTMGHYQTANLPIFRYLHSPEAPNYVVADRFFQAAFGGSFLNHQWLIAARTPLDTNKAVSGARNSVLDDNRMVTGYSLYKRTKPLASDGQLTALCPAGTQPNQYAAGCGDYAVNTVAPSSMPFAGGARIPLIDDKEFPNIGDRMNEAGISWNWYSGGWDQANSPEGAGELFQFHHQPFNYFANYAVGAPGRSHLRDELEFREAARTGHLPTVSFVKPYGAENEHPGYASEPDGSDHLVDLLREITDGPQSRDTLVVVTYDEFGGQWDHVAPPGQPLASTPGPHDVWGPGTRIPALVLGRRLTRSGVDHTSYDTTSILATIERSFGLAPLSSRDAAVNDLSSAIAVGGRSVDDGPGGGD